MGIGKGRKKGQGAGPGPGKRKGQGLRPGHGKEQGPAPGRGPAAATPRGRKEKALANLKPKHPDEQEIPFRLRELMQSREAMKRPKARARRVAEKPQRPQGAEAQEDIPVPRFRRRRGESERSYACRMEREVQHMLVLSKNQVQREPEKETAAPQKSQRKKEAGSESIPWSSCTLLVPGQAGESSRAWLPRGFHGVEALFLPAGCKIALQVSEQKAGQSAEEEGGEERSFAGEEAVPRPSGIR
ncbi:coiled-coil domain-containing protein 137 isoform X2 [Gallus gallus]|uniref:coiled-coil domain-containing protein 137 isoform X2 n=1 Tax=Gallus gallus TaxID=9031 RepID=UPI001AE6094A|nr:coiled-coil domain-containing protein 137 isoform X2 [Gallus gallus]